MALRSVFTVIGRSGPPRQREIVSRGQFTGQSFNLNDTPGRNKQLSKMHIAKCFDCEDSTRQPVWYTDASLLSWLQSL